MTEEKDFAPEIEDEFTLNDNPYFDGHVAGEIDYQHGVLSRSDSRALVASEYRSYVRPRRCICGGELWWRATVGAYGCSCGRAAFSSGTIYGMSYEERSRVQ